MSLIRFVPFQMYVLSFDGNGAVALWLVCRTLDREVEGSILTGAVLGPFTPSAWFLIHKKQWFRPGMTKDMLTSTLNLIKTIKIRKN